MYGKVAYWLTPDNGLIDVSNSSHIECVVNFPETFGLTCAFIGQVYIRHGERVGSEGFARVEIIHHLCSKGFIRCRRYFRSGKLGDHWSFTVGDHNPETLDRIRKFFKKVKEKDRHIPVKLTSANHQEVYELSALMGE